MIPYSHECVLNNIMSGIGVKNTVQNAPKEYRLILPEQGLKGLPVRMPDSLEQL